MGRRGGKATAAALSPQERSEKMSKVVQCRWAKRKLHDQHVAIAPESLPVVLQPDQPKLEQQPGDSTGQTDPLDSIWFDGA